jgi:hypothetical protein
VVKYTKQQMYESHWDYFDPRQYQQQPHVIEQMDLYRLRRRISPTPTETRCH